VGNWRRAGGIFRLFSIVTGQKMKQIQLTDPVKKELKKALGKDDEIIFSEIQAGMSSVFITTNNELLTVLRAENRTLVIVAAVGKNIRTNRTQLFDFAKARNFTVLRFHTQNPEYLAKGLEGLQVDLVGTKNQGKKTEYIYKVVL
jgi:hypothetical protein